jgi:hypothetical protein
LEDLETRLLPVVGESKILTIDFVDSSGKVVNSREIKLPAQPPTRPGPLARPRR